MPADSYHAEYQANVKRWQLLRDLLDGEDSVKKRRTTYLPAPEGRDTASHINQGTTPEYDRYLARAMLYDATSKTVDALVGAMFRKEPSYTLPPALDYLEKDADGAETPLPQLAKTAAKEVTGLGRVGLLVDFPDVGELNSIAEEREQNARAQIFLYTTENVINWRYDREGAQTVLKLLVLREFVEEPLPDDQFETEKIVQYRVYEMVNGVVNTSVYRAIDKELQLVGNVKQPQLPGRQPLTYIPFVFLGAMDLTCTIDKSPVLDIARINISHFRNTADYEDGLFMLGNPTPWIVGLSEEWIDENKDSLTIGSRYSWLLPEGASVGMLEMSNNLGALREAMASKEHQMASLGARLFEQRSGSAVESAETIRTRESGEAAILSSLASNISRAFRMCLEWVAAWMNAADADIDFQTNDDFFAAQLTPQELESRLKAWQAGAITFETLFHNLVAGEIIEEGTNAEEYRELLDAESDTRQQALPFDDSDIDPDDEPEEDQIEEDAG